MQQPVCAGRSTAHGALLTPMLVSPVVPGSASLVGETDPGLGVQVRQGRPSRKPLTLTSEGRTSSCAAFSTPSTTHLKLRSQAWPATARKIVALTGSSGSPAGKLRSTSTSLTGSFTRSLRLGYRSEVVKHGLDSVWAREMTLPDLTEDSLTRCAYGCDSAPRHNPQLPTAFRLGRGSLESP